MIPGTVYAICLTAGTLVLLAHLARDPNPFERPDSSGAMRVGTTLVEKGIVTLFVVLALAFFALVMTGNAYWR